MSDLTEAQRVERARQAQHALEFMAPAFDELHAVYTDRLKAIASTAPWEAHKITALANATRILEEVRTQITGLVRDGVDAQAKIDRAKRVEDLSPARRRLLNIGSF